MKKFTASLILILVINSIAYCQLPAITLYSEKQTVQYPILYDFTIGTSTTITLYVDLGDGNPVEYICDSSVRVKRNITGSGPLIIYGENIISFSAIDQKITSVDLSQIATLQELLLDYNLLTEIDISHNLNLGYINLRNNNLTALDVSNNINLNKLHCENNSLSYLNVQNNPLLKGICCNNNSISELLIDNRNKPDIIECMYNYLKFSTLPGIDSIAGYYKYAPQKPVIVEEDLVVDLSSEYNINGKYTNYIWLKQNGDTLKEGVDYMIENGTTHLFSQFGDSIHCEMRNSSFP